MLNLATARLQAPPTLPGTCFLPGWVALFVGLRSPLCPALAPTPQEGALLRVSRSVTGDSWPTLWNLSLCLNPGSWRRSPHRVVAEPECPGGVSAGPLCPDARPHSGSLPPAC